MKKKKQHTSATCFPSSKNKQTRKKHRDTPPLKENKTQPPPKQPLRGGLPWAGGLFGRPQNSEAAASILENISRFHTSYSSSESLESIEAAGGRHGGGCRVEVFGVSNWACFFRVSPFFPQNVGMKIGCSFQISKPGVEMVD